MPQEFHVVRCFKCEAFQVHIVKKVPKWECKICGEKQSVRQVYGKGTGKDCRLHVQKLNALRADEIPKNIEEVIVSNEEFNENSTIIEVINDTTQPLNGDHKQSKWVEFLDEESENRGDDEVDDNCIPCSKKLKLSDTNNYHNSFSELSNRNPNKIDFRIRNQKTIESYFKSVNTPNQKAFTEKELPIKSENPLKNLKPSNSKNSSYNDKIQPEQLHRKTVFESFKENRKTVTENMSNIISKIISCNEQIKSDYNTDQLYRKTVFESFKDDDNLDSILDTDF